MGGNQNLANHNQVDNHSKNVQIDEDYLLEDVDMEPTTTKDSPEDNAIGESLEGVDLISIAEEWKKMVSHPYQ